MSVTNKHDWQVGKLKWRGKHAGRVGNSIHRDGKWDPCTSSSALSTTHWTLPELTANTSSNPTLCEITFWIDSLLFGELPLSWGINFSTTSHPVLSKQPDCEKLFVFLFVLHEFCSSDNYSIITSMGLLCTAVWMQSHTVREWWARRLNRWDFRQYAEMQQCNVEYRCIRSLYLYTIQIKMKLLC